VAFGQFRASERRNHSRRAEETARHARKAYQQHSRSTRLACCVFRPRHTLQDSRDSERCLATYQKRCGTIRRTPRYGFEMGMATCAASNGSRLEEVHKAGPSIPENRAMPRPTPSAGPDGRLDECLAVLTRLRKAGSAALLSGARMRSTTWQMSAGACLASTDQNGQAFVKTPVRQAEGVGLA